MSTQMLFQLPPLLHDCKNLENCVNGGVYISNKYTPVQINIAILDLFSAQTQSPFQRFQEDGQSTRRLPCMCVFHAKIWRQTCISLMSQQQDFLV